MKLTNETLNPTNTEKLPGGGAVEVRILTQADITEIRKQTRSKKPNRQGMIVEKVDTEREQELMWGAGIVSWKGVELEGKDFPCNTKNKIFLMSKCPEFAIIVTDAIDKLNTALEARTGVELGN